jgi:hypothetical protein
MSTVTGHVAKARNVIGFAVWLAVLAFLGGCVRDEYPVARSAVHEIDALRPGSSYTTNGVAALRTEVMPVRIGDGFTAYERARILRAVNEWNYALNGHVRFEIVEEEAPYEIVASSLRAPNPPPGVRPKYLLANTPPPMSGPMISQVFVQRLGNRDLKALMLHELGHMLGLPHANAGVMSPDYDLIGWRCIDKTTATALAIKRNLPLGQFNWCES